MKKLKEDSLYIIAVALIITLIWVVFEAGRYQGYIEAASRC